MNIQDENYSHSTPYGVYDEININTELAYKVGCYFSKYGIVKVYAQPYSIKYGDKEQLIRLDFYWKGRMYYRTINKPKSITDRSLSIRANQFVKSIINK